MLTCCFSSTICHKKIKIETNKQTNKRMIVFEKQLLKAFHNIEHEPFKISVKIFLPICFAYIYYALCMCTPTRFASHRITTAYPSKSQTAKTMN